MRSALAVALAVACSSGSEPPPKPSAPVARDAPRPDAAAAVSDPFAWHRVEVTVDKLGTVPFLVGIHPDRPEGVIEGGAERLPLVVLAREPLAVRIPVRGIELRFGAADASGRRRGTLVTRYYYKRDFPITAAPVPAATPEQLFPGGDPPSVDLSGAWRIDITDFGVGRATFRQDANGALAGTIIPPEVGDLRHLWGRVTGARAQLSAFDGIHTFHLDMTATDGGRRLTGRWLIAGIGVFPFTATRDAPPETHLGVKARMAPGKTRLTLPALSRAPYRGNPVIVDYFGSWCPVCIDLTPELVRLHAQYRDRGLQILSIALEPPGDEAEIRRRLDEFRAAFGVTWPFELKLTDDFNAAAPPEILDATGFPITIFVRRDGTVAGVHTGFISRAAGPERAAVIAKFDRLAAEIVK